MDSTGGDTLVDPKEKWPTVVKAPLAPRKLLQVRLNTAETGPFTGAV
jgi:hypothetical protein